jgi:glycosyltransferase involved in cell wall biosynthesis
MIDILLPTYNGETYLRQQIDSILQQTYQNWQLIIRDDGSSDNTQDICKEYVEQYPNKICILADHLGNLGTRGSFLTLMQYSMNDYIMFCDQDDIWLPDKVLDTYEQMVAAENSFGVETSIMVYTDLKIVDPQLNLISDSLFKHTNRNPSFNGISKLLMADITYGCTFMFNKKLKSLCKSIPPGIPHDTWLPMIATTFGKMILLDKPTILYRRHGSNTSTLKKVGLSEVSSAGGLISHISNLSERRKRLNATFKTYEIFYNTFREMMTLQQRKLFDDISSIPSRNWFMRRYMIIKHKIFKTGLVKNIGLLIDV